MIITRLKLTNFIGTSKISDENGVLDISFSNLSKNIILIKGENGLGKTTILNSLTPYVDFVQRKIEEAIIYPAKKEIWITKDNIDYYFVIDFLEENGKTSKKGYIYFLDKHTNEYKYLNEDIAKGSITEYINQVENIFGSFEQFKNSVFFKQHNKELIESTPTERLKIINKFMPSLIEYDKHNNYCDTKISNIEFHLNKLKKDLEGIKNFEDMFNEHENNKSKFTEEEIKIINDLHNLNESLKEQFLIKTQSIENIKKEINKINILPEIHIDFDNLILEEKDIENNLLNIEDYRNVINNIIIQLKKYSHIVIDMNLIDELENIEKELKELEYKKELSNSLSSQLDSLILKKQNLEDKYKNFEQFDYYTKQEELLKNKINENFLLIQNPTNVFNLFNEYIDIEDNLLIEDILLKDFNYNKNIKEILENVIKFKKSINISDFNLYIKSLIDINSLELSHLINKINSFKINNSNTKKIINSIETSIQDKSYLIKLLNLSSFESIKTLESNNLKSILFDKNCPTCNHKIDEIELERIIQDIIFSKDKIYELEEIIKKENLEKYELNILNQFEVFLNYYIENSEYIEFSNFILTSILEPIENLTSKLNEKNKLILDYNIFIQKKEKILDSKNKICFKYSFLNDDKLWNKKNLTNLIDDFDNNKTLINDLELIKNKKSLIDFNYGELKSNIEKIEFEIEKIKTQLSSINNLDFSKIDKLKIKINNINILKSLSEIPFFNMYIDNILYSSNNFNNIPLFDIIPLSYISFEHSSIIDFLKHTKSIEKTIDYLQDIWNYLDNMISKEKQKKDRLIFIKNEKEKYLIYLNDQKRKEVLEKELLEETNNFDLWIIDKKFNLDTYNLNKKIIEDFNNDYNKWIIEGKSLELSFEKYKNIEKEIEEYELDFFQWKKIKSYSSVIKKSIITNTFDNFTVIANEILKNDSTIGNIQISINQLNNKKFTIGALNNGVLVKDISNLSGAEQTVVSKAISLALASKTHFKTLWLDESDSDLSQNNKKIVVETLNKILELIEVEQIFIISHQNEVIDFINEQIDLDTLVNKKYLI